MTRVGHVSIGLALLALAVTSGCTTTREPGTSVEAAAPAASTAGAAVATFDPGGAGPEASPAAAANDLPSRVVLPALGIDLPVVSGDLTLPGNPPDYPLCDVAQYLTTYRFPGRPGTTTWIYGHARPGMFLPLLDASERDEGASLIGRHVDVYSTASRRYTYRITRVLRHALDRTAGARVPAGTRRLVLQTSEGQRGTVPKLQVVAELVAETPADPGEASPVPRPRACYG